MNSSFSITRNCYFCFQIVVQSDENKKDVSSEDARNIKKSVIFFVIEKLAQK